MILPSGLTMKPLPLTVLPATRTRTKTVAGRSARTTWGIVGGAGVGLGVGVGRGVAVGSGVAVGGGVAVGMGLGVAVGGATAVWVEKTATATFVCTPADGSLSHAASRSRLAASTASAGRNFPMQDREPLAGPPPARPIMIIRDYPNSARGKYRTPEGVGRRLKPRLGIFWPRNRPV